MSKFLQDASQKDRPLDQVLQQNLAAKEKEGTLFRESLRKDRDVDLRDLMEMVQDSGKRGGAGGGGSGKDYDKMLEESVTKRSSQKEQEARLIKEGLEKGLDLKELLDLAKSTSGGKEKSLEQVLAKKQNIKREKDNEDKERITMIVSKRMNSNH